MEKKYELTDTIKEHFGTTLHRIKAIRDFGNVKNGDLGGWVQSEKNLSQRGNCWVGNNAMVFEEAKVYGQAEVSGNARVYGEARVCDEAWVYGKAKICGKARVSGNAWICDKAWVYGQAWVTDNAAVGGHAEVCEEAKVFGRARVYNEAEVYGQAEVGGRAEVSGMARIGDNAVIQNDSDYIVFQNWWSNSHYFTWTRSNNMWEDDNFYGTGQELIEKAYRASEKNGHEYKRIVQYVEEILKEN